MYLLEELFKDYDLNSDIWSYWSSIDLYHKVAISNLIVQQEPNFQCNVSIW